MDKTSYPKIAAPMTSPNVTAAYLCFETPLNKFAPIAIPSTTLIDGTITKDRPIAELMSQTRE